MSNKIIIINGPNLNLLGEREQSQYGSTTFEGLKDNCLRKSKEGFKVMVYCNDDPLMAKRLENVGASAIMPLASPIGSGLGILNPINIQIIRKQTKLPLIIDAGLGQASDATIAIWINNF